MFYTPDIETLHELPREEAAHCSRVLRKGEGDTITLTDGKGSFYQATITAASPKRVLFQIESEEIQESFWNGKLHLAVAPTKNMDRNEWLAEKATEIGFDHLTFLKCRYSERKVIKRERVEKIMVSAMKQSLKARLPQLDEMVDFKAFVKQEFSGQKFIAYCYSEGAEGLPVRTELQDLIDPAQDTLVLIGPEGDFSEEEIQMAFDHGFIPVLLGPSRLRTETAGLTAVHLMNLTHRKK